MEEIVRFETEEVERQALEKRKRMLADARAALKKHDGDPMAFIATARCCKQLGRLQETLDILRQGISRCARSAILYEYYIERLEKCNRTEEAIAAAHEAALLFPNDIIFPLREALLLPVFYDTREQANYYRRRFAEGLQRMIGVVPLDTRAQRRRAATAIGKNLNKYLPYQG